MKSLWLIWHCLICGWFGILKRDLILCRSLLRCFLDKFTFSFNFGLDLVLHAVNTHILQIIFLTSIKRIPLHWHYFIFFFLDATLRYYSYQHTELLLSVSVWEHKTTNGQIMDYNLSLIKIHQHKFWDLYMYVVGLRTGTGLLCIKMVQVLLTTLQVTRFILGQFAHIIFQDDH